MASAQGQDRSNWQTVGPWHGLDFGIVKATEGLTYRDPVFTSNWANMHAAGITRGAYHFFHPELSAAGQAEYFVSAVRDEGLADTDILVSDTEITAGADGTLLAGPEAARRSALISVDSTGQVRIAAETHDIPVSLPSAAAFPPAALAFLDEVRQLCPRNPVVLYTNLSIAAQLSSCAGFPLWIAYPASAAPSLSGTAWKRWTLWQWAFSGGYDDCDRDAFNGTAAELRSWASSYAPKPPPAPPKPKLLEDDMPQLNAGSGAVTAIAVAPGSATQLHFSSDASGQGMAAPALRVAVHSKAGGWLQIEGKDATQPYVLPATGGAALAFTAKDVDGVSVTRYPQGDNVAVGYTLS
jgi:GH25 family lysozyme M1 (1,4-beta-N-acetylmuramidase)